MRGTICGIYIAEAAGAPMASVKQINAVAQRGLVGDRYFLGTGYYSNHEGWGANVTLIQSEAIAAINAGHNKTFTGADLGRNIVTAGIKLQSLIGHEIQCGLAILRITKPFPPCAHLACLIGDRKILKYLAHCGGIGAEVIEGGVICERDAIILVE